jgi:hypothetical protein
MVSELEVLSLNPGEQVEGGDLVVVFVGSKGRGA